MSRTTSRRPFAVLLALLLAVGSAVTSAPAAHAASAPAVISNLVVTPPDGDPYRTITSSFDWCVPDGTRPGDGFRVVLPDVVGGWASGFPLSTTTGVVVATARINAGPPSYLDVTFTDAVAGQQNVCGKVMLQATARNGRAVADSTRQLTFSGPTNSLSAGVSFGPLQATARPEKWGGFLDVDQCRNDGTDCLAFGIRSQLGPVDSELLVTDNPPAGMSVDCSTVRVWWEDATNTWVRGTDPQYYTVRSCTPDAVQVAVKLVPAGLKAVVAFQASVEPSGSGGVTYTNTAIVASNGRSVPVATAVTSNTAIGTAVASSLRISKRDASGREADTIRDAAQLRDGRTPIVVDVTNTGLDPLEQVRVEDSTIYGVGLVEDFSCDFSGAVPGAPTSGTLWAGPWPSGTSFTCTGMLTGVTPEGHGDIATVSAFNPAGASLRAKNPYYATRELVSVGDHAWLDANRNGIQDAGEAPVAGVGVELRDATGRLVGRDTTSATGFYSFGGLLAGEQYTITFTPPAGMALTRRLMGRDRGADSNPGPDGRYAFRAPASGTNSVSRPDDPTIDVGLVRVPAPAPARVSIGDRVWLDADRDGIQDRGEKPVPGVVVRLLDGSGRTVATTRTDASGRYAFSGLPPRTAYRVVFTAPRGMRLTRPLAGTNRGLDSNPDAKGVARVVTPASGRNLRTTPDDPTIDAGLVLPRTYTRLVQADRYGVLVRGNAAATRANARLVGSLDDDGVLRYREDMGTQCRRTKAPTCLWYRTTSKVLTLRVTSFDQPTRAQWMAAYNAAAPARIGRVSTTARLSRPSGDVTMVWMLGKGATAARPWGPGKNVVQTYLARS